MIVMLVIFMIRTRIESNNNNTSDDDNDNNNNNKQIVILLQMQHSQGCESCCMSCVLMQMSLGERYQNCRVRSTALHASESMQMLPPEFEPLQMAGECL